MNTEVKTVLFFYMHSHMVVFVGSERGSFAKGVNSVRKELLEQARTGGLIVQYQLSTVSATSSEFESTLQHLFRMKLDSQFHV